MMVMEFDNIFSISCMYWRRSISKINKYFSRLKLRQSWNIKYLSLVILIAICLDPFSFFIETLFFNLIPWHFVDWNYFNWRDFFLDAIKFHFSESVFYGIKWASKVSVVSSFYKRWTFWLELETCCADHKSFTITSRPLET